LLLLTGMDEDFKSGLSPKKLLKKPWQPDM